MVKVTGILGTASEVLYKEKYMHIKINPTESFSSTDNGGIEKYRFERPSFLSVLLLHLMY